MTDFRTEPVDPAIAERLREQGLRMELLDMDHKPAADAWSEAAARGFHGGHLTPERAAEFADANRARRNTGVWDVSSSSLEPVGTSNSWVSRLAIPGDRTLDAWAISTVTVASTHHKRGIARALLEAELAAAAKHVPMAMLTVSESSLYQRYGFAPAAWAADYEFNVRRVTWSGPTPDGRIEYITNQQFAEHLEEMHNRLMVHSPGQIDIWPLRAAQIAGTASSEEDRAKKIRAIRYLSPDGTVEGIANYTVSGGGDDFVAHTLTVHHILTASPDAYAAIWRYLLEVPLVEKVKVEHQRVDEPVMWMITDMRAAKVTVWEHQYLRILDVPAVLEARGYVADGEMIFDVSDPYGYAGGRWHLQVQDGVGRVTPAAALSEVPTLELGVAELSAMYLGGVKAKVLVAAGRGTESGDGMASAALMASETVPFLSIWY
ncbi:MAG: GNAT family N-acetyltransferase [Microbacteriaceae bacterium]